MPNETTGAAGTQAATTAQPQEGASQAQAADAQSSQADGADNESSTDVAALTRELAEARREAAKHRTEAQKLRTAAQVAEDAKLPEQERQTKRLAELEKAEADHARERADWQVQQAVTRSAVRLGFQDPIDAFALIDKDAIELDEHGAPRNVDKLMTDLLRAKPYLGANRATGSADGGNRGEPATGHDMNHLLRQAAGRT